MLKIVLWTSISTESLILPDMLDDVVLNTFIKDDWIKFLSKKKNPQKPSEKLHRWSLEITLLRSYMGLNSIIFLIDPRCNGDQISSDRTMQLIPVFFFPITCISNSLTSKNEPTWRTDDGLQHHQFSTNLLQVAASKALWEDLKTVNSKIWATQTNLFVASQVLKKVNFFFYM